MHVLYTVKYPSVEGVVSFLQGHILRMIIEVITTPGQKVIGF